MPYIACDGNRYLAEHSCNIYHYGKQELVRECCLEDAIERAIKAEKLSMTTSHPSYQVWIAAWNSLTDAEMKLCRERLAECGINSVVGCNV